MRKSFSILFSAVLLQIFSAQGPGRKKPKSTTSVITPAGLGRVACYQRLGSCSG